MESKEYQVLHYEKIVDESNNTQATTAEVLEITNGSPSRIYIVPVIGMKLPPENSPVESLRGRNNE